MGNFYSDLTISIKNSKCNFNTNQTITGLVRVSGAGLNSRYVLQYTLPAGVGEEMVTFNSFISIPCPNFLDADRNKYSINLKTLKGRYRWRRDSEIYEDSGATPIDLLGVLKSNNSSFEVSSFVQQGSEDPAYFNSHINLYFPDYITPGAISGQPTGCSIDIVFTEIEIEISNLIFKLPINRNVWMFLLDLKSNENEIYFNSEIENCKYFDLYAESKKMTNNMFTDYSLKMALNEEDTKYYEPFVKFKYYNDVDIEKIEHDFYVTSEGNTHIKNAIIDEANSIRTTHNTVTNETSSRSHAICNISVKLKGEDEEYGKLSLVDLAGSERAQETQSNNRQRRAEGAEINKSLLALKECIRALDEKKNGNPDQHVPFRASKLTHVLRDSFVSKSDKSKIIMISCISPSYSSANHSINTLRYSDRLKEQTKKPGNRNNPQSNINQARFTPSTNNTAPSSNAPITNIPSNKDNNINSNNNNNVSSSNNNNIYSKPTTSSNRAVFNKQQPTNKLHSKPLQQQQQPQPQHQPDYSDRMDIDDVYESPQKKKADDWDYLRKTAAFRDGKMYSDEFVRYHQLTDQLVEDEDNIMNLHMEIIKDDAKLLTEEGDLLSNIKGFGENEDFKMDAYISGLERIINRKLLIYGNIKKKVELYKQHIKEEDELRKKLNPKLFSDDEL
jgi:hypothetical protein